MQFLSLPQWCSAWSVPASTWCGGTGGATPPRAWTSTTPSTARPPARGRRTRSTSVGRTAWGTTRTITPTRRASAWELWEQEVAPARSSSRCHSGAACPIRGLTGTRSSRCSPPQSDPKRGRLPEKMAAQAHAHTAVRGQGWLGLSLLKGRATYHPVLHAAIHSPVLCQFPFEKQWVVSNLFCAGAGSIFLLVNTENRSQSFKMCAKIDLSWDTESNWFLSWVVFYIDNLVRCVLCVLYFVTGLVRGYVLSLMY